MHRESAEVQNTVPLPMGSGGTACLVLVCGIMYRVLPTKGIHLRLSVYSLYWGSIMEV